ncbi:hypothetical protein J7E85_26020 [Paenibacillus sp. ISL-20]|nr:hypothetical protein [Paenibacillus sp. ISL-20]
MSNPHQLMHGSLEQVYRVIRLIGEQCRK